MSQHSKIYIDRIIVDGSIDTYIHVYPFIQKIDHILIFEETYLTAPGK